MKYLKTFENKKYLSGDDRLENSEDGREVLSQIYDIKDEVILGSTEKLGIDDILSDFLVPWDQFMDYADQFEGSVSGNTFDSLSEFKQMIEYNLEGVISPIIYIAPYWFTRDADDILDFGDVYSNTVYVQLTDFVSNFSVEDQDRLKISLCARECYLKKSESGKIYLRIYWD